MSCERSHELNAYYDGELPAESARSFEAHLSHCEPCRIELEQFASLSRQIRGATLQQPEDAAIERWISSFSMRRDRGVRQMASWLTSAAAVLLVATMLTTVTDSNGAQPLVGSIEAIALLPDDDTTNPTVVAAHWMATDLALADRGGDRP